ncbi:MULTISPECIES: hypothetical protein [unclassified Arthrobacter]|uniref:hypothetical protein n=1 Tax=unclassified Arthrobacter TaxID=235627 RepID=UPI000CE33128|nr:MULTISPECIES: hypothetical protein [unclassified Arthrobacter]
MQELRKLPRWALIFSSCVAVVAVGFVVMGVVDLLTGAGMDRFALDVLAAAAFALAAWSIAVKGNPALSRRRDEAPNRRSPLEW